MCLMGLFLSNMEAYQSGLNKILLAKTSFKIKFDWFSFSGLSVQALTTVRFMSNHCNTKHDIFVNNSIVLKLTNQLLTDDPGDQLHCTADLATDTGSRLLIHFLSLSISIENDMPDRYL